MADGNEAAFESLDSYIERLRSLPKGIVRESAPAIAKEAHSEIEQNIALQRDPDGEHWLPGKGGRNVLTGAAQAVNSRAIGDTIIISVEGPEAKHHKGTANGGIKRGIIPTRKIPKPLVDAIKRIMGAAFQRIMSP